MQALLRKTWSCYKRFELAYQFRKTKMMKRLPSMKALRMLEAMIRCGSVRAAAVDQHVTPGAVSQQIRALEAELGLALFDRSARAMKPSAEASYLAGEVSNALSVIATAVEHIVSRREHAPLRIKSLPSIATRMIVPRLLDFRRQAPTVRLNFTYVHRKTEFSIEDADVLLCTVDGRYEGHGTVYPLFSGAVRPVCSKAYLEKNGPFGDVNHLRNADLLHDYDTASWRAWFAKAGVSAGTALTGDVYEDFGLLGHAATSGQGVALCPVRLIEQELAQGDLILVSEAMLFEDRMYCAILPENPRVEAEVFAKWLSRLTEGQQCAEEASAENRVHGG
jgi:LysR family glycine cleavage system transcriptional activator